LDLLLFIYYLANPNADRVICGSHNNNKILCIDPKAVQLMYKFTFSRMILPVRPLMPPLELNVERFPNNQNIGKL